MLTTIAVATDGSDTAEKAVTAAFDLAKRFDAGVVILTAYTADAVNSGAWASTSATHAERVLAAARGSRRRSRGWRVLRRCWRANPATSS